VSVKIVSIFPEVLGTYGDHGNARILAHLVRRSGETPEVVTVSVNEAVPLDGDVYLLGGGEDGPQALAARRLREGSPLHHVVKRGAAILAVCAGYQLLGRSFVAEGKTLPGLGLLPIESVPAPKRMVGEVLSEPLIGISQALMTGFENHGGMTILDDGAQPLARVRHGNGNGDDGYDGVIHASIIGTYLHGPVLARNPGLAQLLLARVGIAVEPSAPHWKLHHERCQDQIASLWTSRHR
jgi:CobQ-like glutamine amidotransferase family enzyme